ncbi:unnamed protein product [Cunninghamella blakesleeana]
MTTRIETLPSTVVEHLSYSLEPKDIFHLSLTSKTLFSIYSNSNIWKSKTIHDFGDLFQIYSLLKNSAGLELYPDLTEKFNQEPSNWCQYYLLKNATLNAMEDEKLMDEADKEYAICHTQLKSFQKEGDINILNDVSSKMMRILDTFPSHGGCYYILGFILFILNQLEDAITLLQMGRNVDCNFEPIDELEDEIRRIITGYKGDEEETALITEDNELSIPLKEVLLEIFKRFDKDNDGALNNQELRKFIYETNGSHPPPPFLRQMGLRFGSNSKGWLTKDGFLAFYLEQTLDDPSETRNDIGVHGYNSTTLKKEMEE